MMKSNDYNSDLSKIPVGPIGSGSKINIVSIAFTDYSFTRDSGNNLLFGYLNNLAGPNRQTFGFTAMKNAITALKNKGGKVKISFGGATFSMSRQVTSQATGETFVQNACAAIKAYGLDGADFDIEDGGTAATLAVYVLRRMREVLGTGYIISLTIPAKGYLYEPYRSIVKGALTYVDYVTLMAFDTYYQSYNPYNDFTSFGSQIGIANKKMSWGVMPGCHDAPKEFTSVEDAKNFAKYVKTNGMAGAMIWSANRDTNHRTNASACLYQTGQPDGTYASTMAAALV